MENRQEKKERLLSVPLTDEDVKKLAEKAGEVGLTVNELAGNFLVDLVGGSYTNGSDERMYANQWFDRCGFIKTADYTFLRHLISWGDLEDVLKLREWIREGKDDLDHMIAHPDEYADNEIPDLQSDLTGWQEQLDEHWKKYVEKNENHNVDGITTYQIGTFEEEMGKVLEWQQQYDGLLNGFTSCSTGEAERIIIERKDESRKELTKGFVGSFNGDNMTVDFFDCTKEEIIKMTIGMFTMIEKLGLYDLMKAYMQGDDLPDKE